MSYYDDLSVGSSENEESSHSDSDNDDQEWLEHSSLKGLSKSQTVPKSSDPNSGLWDRCILHLDVDCFYCQCEEIDRGLRNEPRPLAIGQKHIVVTANYEARKCGVQKLQSREAAYLACPYLWIVEGSDLLHYRRHSRAIYDTFRKCLQQIANELECSSIPASKGCMDEMMADLTQPVNKMLQQNYSMQSPDSNHDSEQAHFIFGEDAPSSVAVLVEDQTGQKTVVSFQPSNTTSTPGKSLAFSRRNVHDMCGASDEDRQTCQARLHAASAIAKRVCSVIRETTGFHTTCGISVSPLLAKLASGLNKPKSVNLLYPWRSSQLLYAMPLRKMHKIGSGTMKALEKQMTSIDDEARLTLQSPDNTVNNLNHFEKAKVRTVQDLLEMPLSSIQEAIQGMAAFQGKSAIDQQCELLIQQCRGLDTSVIVDDDGGIPKTVSVENSFRRGTLQTIQSVHNAMEELYSRLPLLLKDRASWTKDPQNSYPSTIRLTIRMLDPHLAKVQRRRPYITKSKQSPIDGKRYLLQEKDLLTQADTLRRLIKPLIQQLVPSTIDITRINIAVTNFHDVMLAQQMAPNTMLMQMDYADSFPQKRRYVEESRMLHLQSVTQGLVKQQTEKRAKIARVNSISPPKPTGFLDAPSSNKPTKGLPKGRPKPASNGRMKSLRIDHFFGKK